MEPAMSAAVMEKTTELPFSATTPISIARVGLKARDANALADYYKGLLGFEEMRRSGSIVALGAGGRELLEIEGSPALKPDDPRSAGLYHTAFLLPSRADLARWTRHAMDKGIGIDGASDHLVSEAIYLSDPEGNGIEIYADRPQTKWSFADGQVQMATQPLDFRGLLAELREGDEGWQGAPEGSVVGHVHLRVGNIDEAEAWWNEAIGLDTMVHYGNAAVFLSSGGYHHHIGANVWHSRGADKRAADRTGLAFIELASKDGKTGEAVDPWGTAVRTVAA
jgi:catechol 2,3-dioxygenase